MATGVSPISIIAQFVSVYLIDTKNQDNFLENWQDHKYLQNLQKIKV